MTETTKDQNGEGPHRPGLAERLKRAWFPPVAAVGALSAIVAAAMRVRPTPKPRPSPGPSGVPSAGYSTSPASPPVPFEREYTQVAVIGGRLSRHAFHRYLAGAAVGPNDTIWLLGDDAVKVFDPHGKFIRSFAVPADTSCITVGPDSRVFAGRSGRVDIYDPDGRAAGGFAVGPGDAPAKVTAVRVHHDQILVADASARYIRRFDSGGAQTGEIGTRNKTRSFILPNRMLDFDVDAGGIVHACDSGRHRVTSWTLDGEPLGHFGKFGHSNPEDFTGCCNPVNVAVTSDGKIVTAEKAAARVKVFEPGGRLLGIIGPEHFDPMCTSLHLDADSMGRILVADPVRREVKVFSPVVKVGVNEPFCRETASSCVAADHKRRYDPIAHLARDAAGVELRFVYYHQEDQLVASVERNEVDGMIAKTWTVLRAYRSSGSGCERLCTLPLPDGDPNLTGVFISGAGGEVRSMNDLAGKRLAVGRAEAYENSYAADRALQELGVAPREKQAYHGCIPAALSVLEGETDAAVVSSYCVRYGLDEILGHAGKFHVLGRTEPIPFVTFALSERVPEGIRARLKEFMRTGLSAASVETSLPGGVRPPTSWNPEELEVS